MFICMNLNFLVIAIIHERVPRDQPPLPDIGFDLFPAFDGALNMVEYIIIVQVGSAAVLLFLHRYR